MSQPLFARAASLVLACAAAACGQADFNDFDWGFFGSGGANGELFPYLMLVNQEQVNDESAEYRATVCVPLHFSVKTEFLTDNTGPMSEWSYLYYAINGQRTIVATGSTQGVHNVTFDAKTGDSVAFGVNSWFPDGYASGSFALYDATTAAGFDAFDWQVYDEAKGGVKLLANEIVVTGGNQGLPGYTLATAANQAPLTADFWGKYSSSDNGNHDQAVIWSKAGGAKTFMDNDSQGSFKVGYGTAPAGAFGIGVFTLEGKGGPGELDCTAFSAAVSPAQLEDIAWVLHNDLGGEGWLYEDEMIVEGGTSGVAAPTEFLGTAAMDYRVQASVEYEGYDPNNADFCFYVVDGQRTKIADNKETGQYNIQFEVKRGHSFGFGVWTDGNELFGRVTVRRFRAFYHADDGVREVPGEYPTIQAAIDAAKPGETVLVADGTWSGTGNVNLLTYGKPITVRSQNGPDSCTIHGDPGERAFIFQGGEGRQTVIDGMSIQGFDTEFTGAVLCPKGNPTMSRCVFSSNWANGTQNQGAHGAAAHIDGGSILFVGCEFRNNYIFTGSPSGAGFTGGAVYVGPKCEAIFDRCRFDNNHAAPWAAPLAAGGAVAVEDGRLTLIDCILTGNNASMNSDNCRGGALYIGPGGEATVTNCTFSNNGSFYGYSVSVAPEAGKVYIYNSIFVSSEEGQELDGPMGVTYSCIKGGHAGQGNIAHNFAFGDETCELPPSSPCIDAGDNAVLPGDAIYDFDGNTRRRDDEGVTDTGNGVAPIVDMGAQEFQETSPFCYADFTGDGKLDLFDFLGFVNAFNAQKDPANCVDDKAFDLFDFLCFVNLFNKGC